MTTSILSAPLTLPCGITLPGRVVKAAMTEGLADEYNRATDKHVNLYSRWSTHHNGGHVLLTGNVMVDRRHLERPGNVCIDGPQTPDQLLRLEEFARAAQKDGTHCWVQLSHPGRQANALVNSSPIGPSAVKVKVLPGTLPVSMPRAMTKAEINDVVERMAHAAAVCKQVGFRGVEIHAAHGYLLSSFLNPIANIRTDEYGNASLENRMRLLVEVFVAVRSRVGPGFPVGVKLNSSDFQQGGFSEQDCVMVARKLESLGVDLIEISGGNYENPSMMFGENGFSEIQSLKGLGSASSTQLREGYFMVFAKQIKAAVSKKTPIMVTGGFRTKRGMEQCLSSEAGDLVGVGRPLFGDPECVGKILRGETDALPRFEDTLQLPVWLRWTQYLVFGKLIRVGGQQAFNYYMLHHLGSSARVNAADVREQAGLVQMALWHENEQRSKARQLKGLGTVGFELNAPNPMVTPARVALIVLVMAYLWHRR
jgi:2,4-dienoyl-CoA reductase-like NADH-dependent reductase (Old Yellow Enzyme family)